MGEEAVLSFATPRRISTRIRMTLWLTFCKARRRQRDNCEECGRRSWFEERPTQEYHECPERIAWVLAKDRGK